MRQRFIQSFSTSGDVQTAIDGGQLGKPYVVYLENEERIDWNTMSPAGPESDPLTFDILTDGYINWEASMSPSDAKAIRYSLNGGEWTEIISVDGGDCRIPVVAGDTLRFLGDNERYGTADGWPANRFANSTAEFNAKGNIMSLVNSENFDTLTTVSLGAFPGLFHNARTLKDASGLMLPATTLAEKCYMAMFDDCVSLTAAPALPATTLAAKCYNSMFMGCTSLTTAPELPATTLAENCYYSMFQDCASLTTAPEILPATTLPNYCYTNMFQACASLTTAPDLPAAALTSESYFHLFSACTNLNYIKCLATDITAADCTWRWVQGVASTGTFVKHPNMTAWTTGVHGIPAGWTVIDADI